MRVPEYFLYDPYGEWLNPRLQAYRLANGAYEMIPADEEGAIVSTALSVRFTLEDGNLAIFDIATGERLRSQEEWANEQTRQVEEAQRKTEEEKRKVEEAERRAEEAERHSREETAARRILEVELARLRDVHNKSNGHERKNGK